MIRYLAELKTAYETPAQAFARMSQRICAVTLHDGRQIGQAFGYKLTPEGKLACVIEADEDRWAIFQKAALDGGNLFVDDLPVVGPAKE